MPKRLFRPLPLQARLAVLGFVCSVVMIAALIVGHLAYNAVTSENYAHNRLVDSTLTFSTLADTSLAQIDQAALENLAILRGSATPDAATKTQMRRLFDYRGSAMPQWNDTLIVNADGAVTYGRKAYWDNHPTLLQLATDVRRKKAGTLLAGMPFQTEQGLWLWPMARVISGPTKTVGTLFMLVDIDHLMNAARKVVGSPDVMVALVDPDGMGIFYDYQTQRASTLTNDVNPALDDILKKSAASNNPIHTMILQMGAMRNEWAITSQQSQRVQFYIVVGRPKSDILSEWRQQVVILGIIGGAVFLFLSTLTLVLVRQAIAQERIQRDLGKARERYDLAVSGTEDGIWDWDMDSNNIYFSPVWFRILGYEPDELVYETSTWSQNVHPDDIDQARRKLQNHLAGETPLFNDTHRMRRKDGSYIWIEAKARAVRDRTGRPIRMVGTISNVEQKKQHEMALHAAKEAAEEANKAKSRFLANMSHELRTPLNGIMGFSEITRDQMFGPVGSAKYVEYANDIHKGAKHLLAVINDILDFSKIDAGKYDINQADMDLREALEESQRLVVRAAAEKNIALKMKMPAQLPKLYADDRAFRQIMINLLSNAIKFTPSGGDVTVNVGVDVNGSVWIGVQDTGIGIPDKDQQRIFEPFEQVDDIMTRTHEGTGLGLPLVKSLMGLHGGSVELVSEIGFGTTVTLRFPPQATLDLVSPASLAVDRTQHNLDLLTVNGTPE